MSTHTESAQRPLWRNRTFVQFFLGQFVTNAGDSLYSVAILWLVFDLSGSNTVTGIASSMLLLPYLLQAIAGPIVDRLRVKRVLVGTQLVQGAVVLVVPLAAYTGHLSVGLLLALVPTLAVMTTLLFPVQSTVLPRIVADDQLSTGNSALATVTLGLDMLFDALGGLFIAVFGATALFLFDSVTFAVAGLLFFGMAIPTVEADDAQTGSEESVLSQYVDDLRTGVDILRGTVFVEMILATAVSNFAVGVTLAILPSFGNSLGGPALYGLLLGALGIGRLVGSVVASWLNGVPYGRLTAVSFTLAALVWVGSVLVPSAALTVVLFGVAWIPAGVNGVLVSTLNQTVFPTSVLGRISALKGTASAATLPLGSLVGGAIAELLGTTLMMGLAAAGFGFVGLYYAVRPPLRGLPSMNDVDPATFDLGIESNLSGSSIDEE